MRLALVVVLAGCASPSSPGPGPEPSAQWTYHVTVDRDLARLNVTMCFSAVVPPALRLGESTDALGPLRRTSDGVELPRDGDVWPLSEIRPGDCVEYDVDLMRAGGLRSGGDVVLRTGAWLLRPVRRPRDAVAELTLDLPDGIAASLPWQQSSGGAYRLGATSFEWTSRAAFGRFQPVRVEAAGAVFHVVVLDGAVEATPAGVHEWITEAAECAATVHGGRFPVPRVQVLVEPVASRRSPVPFGETRRGGGPAVYLLLAADAADEEMPGEWVAVHEFLHLGMPWIDDPWLAEGLATYYQNVARARGGSLTPADAWRLMHEGFQRGRNRTRGSTLAEASDVMRHQHGYMRVYWSGAAIALAWDVELRRSSGGRLTLDDAIRELWRAYGGDGRLHDARGLVEHLDAWLGRPLFSQIAFAALASREFPPVDELTRDLGLEPRRGVVRPRSAPLGAIREAIMQ